MKQRNQQNIHDHLFMLHHDFLYPTANICFVLEQMLLQLLFCLIINLYILTCLLNVGIIVFSSEFTSQLSVSD